jgi:hypothetical protein
MSPSPPGKKATRLAGRDAKTKKIDGETLADSAAAVNRKRTKPKDESIEFDFRRKLIWIGKISTLLGSSYQRGCPIRNQSVVHYLPQATDLCVVRLTKKEAKP